MEGKQSPLLAYRIPEEISKEDRDKLNKQLKDIAKARGMNYFELFSLWVANDHLLGIENIKQIIKPDLTQAILDRLDKLEKSLTLTTQLSLPFGENVKQDIKQEQKVKQNIEQIIKYKETKITNSTKTFTKEELIARVKDLHSQGKNSEEIAKIFTEENIPTPKGKGGWSARTIRDWIRAE